MFRLDPEVYARHKDEVLRLPRRMAINFHDGPLPRYAGLNTPVWALLNGETARLMGEGTRPAV